MRVRAHKNDINPAMFIQYSIVIGYRVTVLTCFSIDFQITSLVWLFYIVKAELLWILTGNPHVKKLVNC